MKITINLDCTPEEARQALGLPDLGPLNAMFIAEMEKRMKQGFDNLSPEAAVKMWAGMTSQGMEHWQKLFFGADRKPG